MVKRVAHLGDGFIERYTTACDYSYLPRVEMIFCLLGHVVIIGEGKFVASGKRETGWYKVFLYVRQALSR